MKTVLLSALFVLIFNTEAISSDISLSDLQQNLNFAMISELLINVYGLERLPLGSQFSEEIEYELINPQDRKDMEPVTNLFEDLRSLVFKDVKVELRYCLADCGFSAEYYLGQIHLQIDLIKEIQSDKSYGDPMNVIKYIVMHELSHFVHEISTKPPYANKTGLSINGNISAYNTLYEDFYLSLYDNGGLDSEQNIEKLRRFERDYFIKSFRMHSEVDAIATIKLANLGFIGWDDVFMFINKTVNEDLNSTDENTRSLTVDMRSRAITIQKTLEEHSL